MTMTTVIIIINKTMVVLMMMLMMIIRRRITDRSTAKFLILCLQSAYRPVSHLDPHADVATEKYEKRVQQRSTV